jgi:hypothetical protein
MLDSDFNPEFVKLMQNRMETSRYKYGPWKDNRVHVDALANAITRIDHYKKTKNLEGLVDAANFLMMEYTLPILDGAYFRAEESGESPKLVKY